VAGGHEFRQVDAGGYHTCAVTTDYHAYCWGRGQYGQIGNGKTYLSYWPRPVSGGLSVRRVTAGIFHTCAETTGSRAWCWGSNSYGATGNGGTQYEHFLKPVAVAGGLSFAQMSAGGWHTCAKTAAGAGFCWGYGFFGQLGDGSSSFGAMAFAPVPVGPPLPSASATTVTFRAAGTGTVLPWEADVVSSGRQGIVPRP
jgi:alpha-tubulin suppressor-like RCC1 family protein